MKGFLQRMAANAVRPQSGIHPLVGSIYGGPTTGKPRGVVEEGLEEEFMVPNLESAGDERNDPRADPETLVSGMRAKGGDRRHGVDRADSRSEGRSKDVQASPFRPLVGKGNLQSAGS